MDQATKKALQIYAAKIRLGIVDSTNSAKSGHPRRQFVLRGCVRIFVWQRNACGSQEPQVGGS